jgi:hypothetical protein
VTDATNLPGDKRRFSRVAFEGPARLRCGGQLHEGQVLDISLHGALLARDSGWGVEPGQRCTLEIPLDEGGVVIAMEVTAVHAGDARVGLRYDRLDVDSMSHLRRLVELNLGDPALLERDLQSLIAAGDGDQSG